MYIACAVAEPLLSSRSVGLDKTMTTGRWEHASTARIYIQEATAQASEMRLSTQQLVLFREAAKELHFLEST